MPAPIRIAIAALAILGASALAACTTEGGGAGPEVASSVPSTLATPCIDAASQKYYMLPDRVQALSAEKKGRDYEVTMSVDTRSALCTVSTKGSVVSVIDTTPESADQIAADKKPEQPKKKSSAD